MNRSDQNIDELLNSFIDGELTASQQSEVERLIAEDARIARRLQQLQKTKMLVSSLPQAQAPGQITEQVKASLATRQLLAQQPVFSKREGTRQLLVRRVLAAAAMIALVAILAGVIYTIVAPETAGERPAERTVALRPTPAPSEGPRLAGTQVEGPSLAAEAGFSGRLELKTAALVAVDAFINRAIEDNGLSEFVSIERQPGKGLYSLSCSRQDLKLLLSDLQSIWQKFDSTTLFVDTEQFAEPVVVNAVTAEQASEIVNQDSAKRSIEMAKDFAVLNNMSELMPGEQILTAIDDRGINLIDVPKPFLTGGPKKAKKTAGQPKEMNLTLVIIGSE